MAVGLAQRGEAPDPVGAGHAVRDLARSSAVAASARRSRRSRRGRRAERARAARAARADWLSTCALTYMTRAAAGSRRAGDPAGDRRAAARAGWPRSIGISKIDAAGPRCRPRLVAYPAVGPPYRAHRIAAPGRRAAHRGLGSRACRPWPIDARDAFGARLRGWGRYARELLAARCRGRRRARLAVSGDGRARPRGAVGSRSTLPRALRRRGADLVHAPNCFLPLRGRARASSRPRPRLRGLPEDFAPRTRAKYRPAHAAGGALGRARDLRSRQFTRDDVVARYGVDEPKVRVIAAGAGAAGRVSLPRRAVRRTAPPYLLARRRPAREEEPAPARRARWRRCGPTGSPHRLVLAGVDARRGRRALARRRAVELPGYVDDARLDALMRGADALVHPSLYEGFGLVVLEAMARGVPVVAARRDRAARDRGRRRGAASTRSTPADIAAAIRAVARRRRSRSRGARAARGRRRCSWERTARGDGGRLPGAAVSTTVAHAHASTRPRCSSTRCPPRSPSQGRRAS